MKTLFQATRANKTQRRTAEKEKEKKRKTHKVGKLVRRQHKEI